MRAIPLDLLMYDFPQTVLFKLFAFNVGNTLQYYNISKIKKKNLNELDFTSLDKCFKDFSWFLYSKINVPVAIYLTT